MNNYALIKDLVDKAMAEYNTINVAVIILIVANLSLEIVRFVGNRFLSNQDKKNKKQLFIEEKRIKVLEQLFQQLDSLTFYDTTEEHELLENIKEVGAFVTKNKLYIPKKFQKITNEILDYFKNVLADKRQKSLEKELALFQKFCDDFNR